jgi:hypothetical protein
MFTWICPKCGREVPPAYNDCPDCAPRNAQPPAVESQPIEPAVPRGGFGAEGVPEPAEAPAPPPVDRPAPPPPPFAAQAPVYAKPSSRSKSALMVALLAVGFAALFICVVGGIYWMLSRGKAQTASTPAPMVESPAAKHGGPVNPFQKYIEISAVRFMEDPKHKNQTLVKYIVTNHSPADIPGLAGNVTLWGRTQKSEEDAQGTFSFTANMAPLESKELTATLNTKYHIYELPDWQNLSADLQITAPGEVSGGLVAPQ